jgi:hypothetical protein
VETNSLFNDLRLKMDEILYREETMWLQRSRIAWLKEGDKNTKKFHMKAAGRAKKNKIRWLRGEGGSPVTDSSKMEEMARSFFQTLYDADPDVQPGWTSTIDSTLGDWCYEW